MCNFVRNLSIFGPPDLTTKHRVLLAVNILKNAISPADPDCWSHLALLGDALVGMHLYMQEGDNIDAGHGALRAVAWDIIRTFQTDLDLDADSVAQLLTTAIVNVASRMMLEGPDGNACCD